MLLSPLVPSPRRLPSRGPQYLRIWAPYWISGRERTIRVINPGKNREEQKNKNPEGESFRRCAVMRFTITHAGRLLSLPHFLSRMSTF